MQIKPLAISALVAAAKAAEEVVPPADLPIIKSVLPPSALAYISESGVIAFSKHIASEFNAGSTPGWFYSLPTSVQTDLVPLNSTLPSSSSVIVNSNSSSIVVTNSSSTFSKPVKSTPNQPKMTPSGGSSAGAGSSSSSSAGASIPSAVIGAGLAGVVGIAGLFAL